MNLSLKNRVSVSFGIATIVVLILSFMVFNFLNSLNNDIENITEKSNRVSLLTDEIRITAVSILKYQRRILINKNDNPEQVTKLINLCESFTSQLQTLDSLYSNPDIKKVVAKMLSYVDSLKLILSKSSLYDRDSAGIASIGELADKILDTFTEFQDIQYVQSMERNKKIKSIISITKKHMMITLIIGFLGTIILGLVIPGKIALPFKKIKDAIRELQDCNFDVSIYYNQDDEIGELAREMNKMIQSFKVFEELRADRINVENRKFDVMANMVKKPVLVANAEGKLIYLNNKMYGLLKVSSDEIIGKNLDETTVPTPIIESYELAIKRRSKLDNIEISIPLKHTENESDDLEDSAERLAHGTKKSDQNSEESEYAFKGYASVVPIRGKDSSLDYYLMVLSTEVIL